MAITGKRGYITLEGAGTVCDITDWSVDVNVGEVKTTPITSTTHEQYVPGLISGTASFTSYTNLHDDFGLQDSLVVTFVTEDGTTIEFDSAFITRMSQTVNVINIITYQYSIRASNSITITT